MNDLTLLRAALDAVDPGAGPRADGWTGARRRAFLEAVAEGHTVEAACASVGLSVASAYALRRRAGGEAFALGWRAAALLARDRLADILTSRAIDGQIETYTRADGQEVTRHRYDNRLAATLLARLDRLAEGVMPPSRAASPPAATGAAPTPTPSPDDPQAAACAVAADFAAFLALVEAGAGADAVRGFVERAIAARIPQLPQLRAPDEGEAEPPPAYDDLVWWERDAWRTSLPPPPNFRGRTFGHYGDEDYWRTLTAAERRVAERRNDAALAAERAAGEALRLALLGEDGA